MIIPDSHGNNRLDSLSNIVETKQLGLLFLIPGMDETLRVNGKAHISKDIELIKLFKDENKLPKTCILVDIQEVFLHCAKAFMRSKLWMDESRINRSEMPTMGQMLKDQIGGADKVERNEDAMVMHSLEDLENMEKDFKELLSDWRLGTSEIMSKQIETMKMDYPDIYKSLLLDRNTAWLIKLDKFLDDKRVEFILVGSLHLHGEGGLLKQMRAKGYRVTQVVSNAE